MTDLAQLSVLPPRPPSNEEGQKTNGTFLYVKDENTREMLVNCWQAIHLTEMWDFIKEDPGEYGFMFSTRPEMDIIYNKMSELPNSVGHSGFSVAWTFRQMQFIAKSGEEAFKKNYIQKNYLQKKNSS